MLDIHDDSFHLLTVGWSPRVIERLFHSIQQRLRIRVSHIPLTADGLSSLDGVKFAIRQRRSALPVADGGLLSSLEGPGVPSIRTMIMADDLVRRLDYGQSLAYANALAQQFHDAFEEARPTVILGGFDGLHSAIGFAVARRLQIPWMAMHFSVIPRGLGGFCQGLTPGTGVQVWRWNSSELHQLAARTVADFESRVIVAPAYRSANTGADVAERLPQHIETLVSTCARAVTGRRDAFTEYSPAQMCLRYVRKRTNLIRLPSRLLAKPPDSPFVFFGLHRQPESSIDVWAPFFSDQLAVATAIARATPPTHQVLIKLHKSDADNYSPTQLREFERLPGVKLVSPFASARDFVEQADLVFGIQGTLALEAALLRVPVVVFGDSKLVELPSVTTVGALADLPALVRATLAAERPNREKTVDGLAEYLKYFAPACYNDWDQDLTESELDNVARLFEALRQFIQSTARTTSSLPRDPHAFVGGLER